MIRKHPYFLNVALLLTALVGSVGLGAVMIPPGTIFQILLDQVPGFQLVADWSDAASAIVLLVRLPHQTGIHLRC